jgi:iron complex outermembrane receptor protein
MKKSLDLGLGCSMIALLAVLSPSAAFAQTAAAVQPQASADAQPAPGAQTLPANAPDAAAPEKDIIVTGSLISNNTTAPTPLTVVSSEELKATTPSNIPDGLNKLPVFLGSNSGRTSGTTTNNNAGNTLNLRNFGTNRTLVLLDGHRVAPSNFNGTVNVDILPQMLVTNVDVVTGGASATYGSDAVTGVVNFVLDKHLNGIKYNGSVGISDYGDAVQYQLGVAAGTDLFGGRGHFEFSVNHFNSDRVPSSARPYNSDYQGWSRAGAGTAANPYTFVEYGRLPLQPTQGGVISCTCGANNMRFIGNGILGPFNPGTPTGTPGLNIGGDGGGYFTTSSFNASLRTTQGFARLSYDLDDDTTAYVNVTAARSENVADFSAATINPGTGRGNMFYTDNAYLTPAAKALVQAGNPTNTFKFAEFFDTIQGQSALSQGRLFQTASDDRYISANLGVDGKLFDRFNWSLYYTYGYNWQQGTVPSNANVQKQLAAQDAVLNGAGQVVCYVSTTQYANLYPGCVPLNPFGPDTITREAFDYITDKTFFVAKNTMNEVGGSLSGSLFDLPAGPVKAGASAAARWLTLDVESDFVPRTLDCTGLRLCVPNSAALYDQSTVAPSSARMSVIELAGELNVPLIHNTPMIDSLTATVAGRYTKYSTSGSVTTWKVGLDYRVVPGLRFRGTMSRDIRAPNLYDLYAPLRVATGGYADLLTGGNFSIQTRTQGNPNLVPEIAKTYTGGVVLTPSFLPRFSLSIDYFKIDMTNAITSISGGSPDIQNLCYASGGTSPYCALTVRPFPITNTTIANFPTAVITTNVNSATVKTEGVDIEANYRFDMSDIGKSLPGAVSLRTLVSHQPYIKTLNYPGSPVNLTVMPKTRVSAFLGYTIGSWQLNLQDTWFSHYSRKTLATQVFTQEYSSSFNTLDFSLNKKLNLVGEDNPVTFYVSVQNVFNTQPPLYTTANTNPGLTYPVLASENAMGRYYLVGLRGKF